jgi:hypothetical protein
VIPVAFGAGSSGTTATIKPPILVCDYDDATPLTSEAQYTQYDTMKFGENGKILRKKITPRIASAVYAGGITNGYTTKSMQWVGTSADVQHYGIKAMFPAVTGAVGISFDLYRVLNRVWVQFRNTR